MRRYLSEEDIPVVCSCRIERKGAVGQGLVGLLEKILLAMVAAVVHATTILLLLLREHSSRVHKQTDKTRGEGAEQDSGGTVAIRLSKYLTISSVALCSVPRESGAALTVT